MKHCTRRSARSWSFPVVATLALVVSDASARTSAAVSEEEPFQQALVRSLRSAGDKMVALAEATPPEDFSWRPSEGVRAMSQVYMHVVASNFQLPATLGAPQPDDVVIPLSSRYERRVQRLEWEETVREKEDVINMLERSFAYAIAAIPQVTGLDEVVAPMGFRDSRASYLLLVVSHAHEHLGQAIAYARSAGVTPPWSEQSNRVRAESVATFDGARALGHVVAVDGFGNIETDLVLSDLERLEIVEGDLMEVTVAERTVTVFLGRSPWDVGEGEWFAVVNREGRLVIGRNYAAAAATLECEAGQDLSIQPSP